MHDEVRELQAGVSSAKLVWWLFIVWRSAFGNLTEPCRCPRLLKTSGHQVRRDAASRKNRRGTSRGRRLSGRRAGIPGSSRWQAAVRDTQSEPACTILDGKDFPITVKSVKIVERFELSRKGVSEARSFPFRRTSLRPSSIVGFGSGRYARSISSIPAR